MEYAVSVLYVFVLVLGFVVMPRHRLGIMLFAVLTSPPYIDYELAWIGQIAYRETPGIRDVIGAPVVYALDAFLLLGLLFFVGEAALSRKVKVMRFPQAVAVGLLLLLALALASTMVAALRYPQLRDTVLVGLANSLRLPLAVMTTVGSIRRGPRARETIMWICLGILVFSFEGLYVTWVKTGTVNLFSSTYSSLIPGPGGTGAVYVLTLPLIAANLALPGRRIERILLLIALAIGSVCMVATYTRSVLLGAIVSTVSLVWILHADRFHVRLKKLVVPFACLIVAAVKFGPQFFYNKMVATFTSNVGESINLGARLRYWSVAYDYLRDNLFLGIGPQMWGMAVAEGGSAHNFFIQYAVENGALAGVIHLAVWYIVLRIALKRLRCSRCNATRLEAGIIAGLAGLLICQLFSASGNNCRMIVLTWTLVTTVLLRGGVAW